MEITMTGLISTLLTGGILLVAVMGFLLTIFNSILESKLDKKTKELSKNQEKLSKDVAELKTENQKINDILEHILEQSGQILNINQQLFDRIQNKAPGK